MKRHFMTLILTGFVGSLVLVGNAEACHKKKKCTCAPAPVCAPAPAPCVVVEPAPCPPPAPVCEPAPACAPKKKCGLFAGLKGMKLGCHKKAVVCAGPVVEAPCSTPAPCGETVAYSAPATYIYTGTMTGTVTAPLPSVQH
ncbi:MAG: hypothetical protein U0790_17915 [Isosphaeraceae bacterium]